jgi:hypothetical protein
MAAKKPRLSLTKTQLQAGVGAELLALCQAVTADGTLTAEEIKELRKWLAANRSSDLPAIGFLVSTLNRILADGKVTAEERKELYAAIETVLPPEARRLAVAQRKAVEAEQKAQARQERDAQKHREREERQRQRPLDSFNFMVAGVHYEGRPEVVREHMDEGDPVFLARDPENKFSRNAVEVRLRNGMQIGFVPEDYATKVAPLLDQGCPHVAYITKVLRGGRVPIPVVQAYLHRADAEVEGLVFPADVPPKCHHSERRIAARSSKSGCIGALLFIAVPLAMGAGLVAWALR